MTEPVERPAIAAAIVVHDSRVLMVRRRVREGELSWQFPAGEVETGESSEDAAVRETQEEVGLTIKAVRVLGRRVHPKTGRAMVYIACEHVAGTAQVVDAEEIAEVAWCEHQRLAELVPYGLFEPVQIHLNQALERCDKPGIGIS